MASRISDDLRDLSILDALEDGRLTSQRAIARATGLNLAKVNFCLKKLVEKGNVKLKNISESPNKLRYLYLLTPSGVVTRSRLTIKFLKRTAQGYSQAEKRIRRNFEEMRRQGAARVAILGKGDVAEILIKVLKQEHGLELSGVFCAKGESGTMAGFDLYPLEKLMEHDFDRVILVDPEDFDENLSRLKKLGLLQSKIWLLR
ncbi:MAG: MarR family EPS-associated transcriptional regulator [Deltaproteobacteria bacterium]|nr:MarR family EPS-associated transcriptional regulator [Deltaproteobacteria bacterium]